MIRLAVLLGLFGSVASAVTPRAKLQGDCMQGNQTVTTSSIVSVTKVMRSYPSCTVTVYVASTLTLASLYMDDSGTPKANPFTAGTDGIWFAYADDGRYDVKLSNVGISPAFTRGDYQLLDWRFLQTGAGAVARPIKTKLAETFSVKDFGAVGDHSTDDTAAIQAAITAACANGSAFGLAREVHFPAGRYNLTGTLPTCSNLTLTGEGGERSVILYYTGTGVAIDVTSATFDKNMVTLKYLWLIGSDGSGSVGIRNSPASLGGNFNLGLRLSSVFVQHFDKGIEMRNSLLVSIERSEFSNNRYGVYIDPVDLFTTISIADTRITENTVGGLYVNDSPHTGTFPSSSLTILGGNIETNASPQFFIGSKTIRTRIWGVHFETNIASIEIDVSNSRGVSIENCYFSTNGSTAGNTIYSSGGAQTVLMSGNTMFNNGRLAGVPTIKFEGLGNEQVVLENSFLDGFTDIHANGVTYINNLMSGAFDISNVDPNTRKMSTNGTSYAAAHSGDATPLSGFLGAGKRQNYLLFSEDISNAIWSVAGGATKGTCVGAAPDGTNTACTVSFASGSLSQTPGTQTNNKLMTFSFWARALDTSAVRRISALFYDSGTDSVQYVQTLTGTWTRYSFVHKFIPVAGALNVKVVAIDAAPFDTQIWGAQLSEGGLTGYVKTTNALVDEPASFWNENGFGYLRMTGINNIFDGVPTTVGMTTFRGGSVQGTTPLIDIRAYYGAQIGKLNLITVDAGVWEMGGFKATSGTAVPTGAGLNMSYAFGAPRWGAIYAYDYDATATKALALQHTGGNVIIGNLGSTDDGVNRVQVNGAINTNSGYKIFGTAGLTQTIVVKGSAGANCNLVFQGGIVTSTTCP